MSQFARQTEVAGHDVPFDRPQDRVGKSKGTIL
jgi:hypothetical protein